MALPHRHSVLLSWLFQLRRTSRSPFHVRPTAQDHLRFRSDAASTGLIVTVEKERLVVTSQDKILFDTGWSRSTAGCPGVLSVTGHSWILHGPSEKPIADGNAPEITVSRLAVTGTHAMTAGIRAEVTTQPHGSNPTTRQAAAAIIVTVCSMLLALALFRWRPGRGQRIMLPRFRPTWFDGAVVVFTAAWALLAPAFYDDGWFLVT